MDVTISTKRKNSYLQLVLTFEENIDLINFDVYPIDSLIYIYISQIQQEDYSIEISYIENSNLILMLNFN